MVRGEVFLDFEIPREVKRTTQKLIYAGNPKREVGKAIFRPDGSVGLYVKEDIITKVSRDDIISTLGNNNYSLGVLGRESRNRTKPLKF